MVGGCAELNASQSFRVTSFSFAQAEALAIARSFVEALVDANVCGFCDIASNFITSSFEKIAINAAAEAEAEAEADAEANYTGTSARLDTFVEAIVSASTPAFAQVRAPIIVQGPSYYLVLWQHSAKCVTSRHAQVTWGNHSGTLVTASFQLCNLVLSRDD